MKRIAAVLGVLVMLAGCTTIQGDLEKLNTLTQKDVQAALDDAKVVNDPVAQKCYQAVLDFTKTQPVGIVSAAQKARDFRRLVVPACKDLTDEEKQQIVDFLMKAGVLATVK